LLRGKAAIEEEKEEENRGEEGKAAEEVDANGKPII
jgi:hypothetical protein